MAGRADYYIGLEGVSGRWRVGVLSDVHGVILNAVRLHGGVALHTLTRTELQPRLFDLVRRLLAGVRLPNEMVSKFRICIGLTGVSFPFDAEIDLAEAIAEMPWLRGQVELICTGDAEITFASYAKCGSGSAMICHAGSVAYSVIDGKPHRLGGWGPAFGDQGSGYAMGRILLQRISRFYDAKQAGDEDRSFKALWERLDRWLIKPGTCDRGSANLARSLDPLPEWELVSVEWKRIRSVIEDIYGHREVPSGLFALAHHIIQEHGAAVWWSIVSSFAIPLFDAWQDERAIKRGNRFATNIVEEATRELVEQYRALRDQLSPALNECPLVLAGGICNHNPEFRECLIAELSRRNQRHGPVITKDSPGASRPVIGALLMALGESTRDNLCLPNREIMRTVARTSSVFPEALAND